MSLDYPEYQKLRKFSRLLSMIWRVGDLGYYVGVFGTVIFPLSVISLAINGKKPLPWDKALLMAIIGMIISAGITYASGSLKNLAIEKGKKLKNK